VAASDAPEQRIAESISNSWSLASSEKDLNLQVSFRLTKGGDAYGLKLLKGFDDPTAIRSAIHAILFAMPFGDQNASKSVFTCTISGDGKKPQVSIVTSEPVGEKVPPISEETKYYFYPADSQIAMLCNQLYESNNSSEAIEKIEARCKPLGVDYNDSQTWKDIGRALARPITIQRNPPGSAVMLSKGAAAAYFRAWQLKRTKQNLYAVEEACAQLASLEVLKASKADPLILASAAILTYQFKAAKELYAQSVKEGSTRAKTLSEQFVAQSTPTKYPAQRPASDSWEKLLDWLPEDTELLIVGTPSTAPIPTAPKPSVFFAPVTTENNAASWPKLSDRVLETNKLFSNAKIAVALHAARRFEMPKGIGVGSSDSVDILVLQKESQPVVKLVLDQIRTQQVGTQTVEGTDILVFGQSPFTFGRSLGSNGEIAQFVCSPKEGMLIAANRIDILRDILIRIGESCPPPRALPTSLPEWKHVDTSASTWGIKHNSSVSSAVVLSSLFAPEEPAKATTEVKPRAREIGMSFSQNQNRMTVSVIADDPVLLKMHQTQWYTAFNSDGMWVQKDLAAAKSQPKSKSSIVGNVLTVEGPLDQPNMIMLVLINSLGYFVAI